MSSAKRRDIAQVQSEGPQLEPGRVPAVWTEPRDCSLSSLCEPLGALLGSLLCAGRRLGSCQQQACTCPFAVPAFALQCVPPVSRISRYQ